MKKRILAIALAAMALLSACGGEQGNETKKDYTADDAQALLDAGVFDGEMEAVDSYVAAMLYGLDEADVTEAVCYMAADTSASADELAVLILADEAAAQKAEAGCKKRIESQIETCRDYCPAAVPHLEDAAVLRRGNTVLLAVGDPDTLPGALEKLSLT